MKILLIFCLILFPMFKLYPHDFNELMGTTIGVDLSRNAFGTQLSPNINMCYFLLNMEINAQFQKSIKPSYNLYLGIALYNFLQLKYGTNFSDNRFKIQTTIPIFSYQCPSWMYARENWFSRINIQLHWEINFTDRKYNNIGIGISYLISREHALL